MHRPDPSVERPQNFKPVPKNTYQASAHLKGHMDRFLFRWLDKICLMTQKK